MILIVTSKFDAHADLVIQKMREKGIEEFIRVNTEDFPLSIQSSVFIQNDKNLHYHMQYADREIRSEDIDSVWYRRPLPPTQDDDGIKSQYTAFQCDGYLRGLWASTDCKWVSHPLNIRAASYKTEQLQKALKFGFNIPETLITNSPEEAIAFAESTNWQVIVKAVDQRAPKLKDKIIVPFARKLLEKDRDLLQSLVYAPVIMQKYVEKAYELRVTIIGQRVFTVRIDSQQNLGSLIDWRQVPCEELPHQVYKLEEEVSQTILDLVASYGLNFGTIDIIVNPNGEKVFLELNPNGQWVWMEQILGAEKLPMIDAMIDLLTK